MTNSNFLLQYAIDGRTTQPFKNSMSEADQILSITTAQLFMGADTLTNKETGDKTDAIHHMLRIWNMTGNDIPDRPEYFSGIDRDSLTKSARLKICELNFYIDTGIAIRDAQRIMWHYVRTIITDYEAGKFDTSANGNGYKNWNRQRIVIDRKFAEQLMETNDY